MIAIAHRFATPLALCCALGLAACNGTIAALEPALSVADTDEKAEGRQMIGKPYKVGGRWYHPKEDEDYDKTGLASWYGPKFHGRRTANGERFNQNALTAAHPTLPLPSYVRVTVERTGKSAVLRINDRGPFKRGRIIDVSKAAADDLGFRRAGHAKVRVEYLGPAPVDGSDEETLVAARSFGKKSKEKPAEKSRGVRDYLPFGLGRKNDEEEGAEDVKVRLAAAPAPEDQADAPKKSHLPGVARRYTERRSPVEPVTATAYAETEKPSGAIDAVIALNAEAEPAPIQAQPLPETADEADDGRLLDAFDMFASSDNSGVSRVKRETLGGEGEVAQ
ncbi:MAG: septal ring lytic transglycosylase RlpA family protein [Pseudomonadota bacterium]